MGHAYIDENANDGEHEITLNARGTRLWHSDSESGALCRQTVREVARDLAQERGSMLIVDADGIKCDQVHA